MKRIPIITLFLLLCNLTVFSTHQRSAEIIYRHISGLTYEIKIITYTRNNIANDSRTYLPIEWGDGKFENLPRVLKLQITTLPYDVVYNEYVGRHTYPGVGTYVLAMEDPNRNYGVLNIPNSVNVPIYVESELIINPFTGGNNSVELLNEPIDYGCVNRKFIHNPGAYDRDGDSLSYKLIDCRGAFGEVIPGYVLPNEVNPDPKNTFTINEITGDVVWDIPNLQGEFNIAIFIEEWRNGVKVGSVVRDMQIIIIACDEHLPVFDPIQDTCVEAGDTLSFDVRATSQDGDLVTITANGGPFEFQDNPAFIEPDPGSGDSVATTTFYWETNCTHVRKAAYRVYFKAVDDGYPISLADYYTMHITVNAPAPENLNAQALGNAITLNWDKSICDKAAGYKIYRRNGYYGFIHGYCETGVPAYTGYQQIHEIIGVNNTTFKDDNNGNGLIHGINYCYMVTAYFNDGGESYASLEACASLKRDLPVITNVSNDSSNNLEGNVYLAWSKPVDLDTIENPGPYQYKIYRAETLSGSFTQIGTNYGLNDTIYFDNEINLNSVDFPYKYRIGLFSETIGDIGASADASSIFMDLYETDEEIQVSWNIDVPWTNDTMVVYRKDPGSTYYESIGLTTNNKYSDKGLINGKEYWYYVKSIGSYSTPGIFHPLINYSQKDYAIPIDNVPPCPPVLSATTDCDNIANTLIWYNPNDTCDKDIEKYLVYFATPPGINLILIDSTFSLTYIHNDILSVIGCYGVKAVDSVGNISEFSNIVCIDTLCGGFRLPNAFIPNDDGRNDYFRAFPGSMASVQKINLIIFDRNGSVVYQTNDKFFKWNGTDYKNGKPCPEAVYFYVCDIFEIRLEGITKRTLKGSVTLFR